MGEEAEKTTLMILNVDLQCSSCYKKVKKVICKFPQIKDRKFDEKANKVFITVVCCSPEKIRDKLCYKGCGVIKSIEIVPPPNVEKSKPTRNKSKEPVKLETPKPKIQESEPAAQPPYRFCSEGIPGGPPPPPPPPQPCYEPFFGCRCGQYRCYYGCRCVCYYGCRCGCNNYYCDLDNSSCSIM
ncbi:heavy metal-associated isoprenylated plant protein 6 [Ipomoea triloba]|uniref:heavy metal-associated isoprenylated plant protein 6 n=1 Tax=Ipomoea triloba TaxID=35885 RepID=UPI00125DC963|nr:heavy metal-associated isoprenylated plant protein 6 [Ipomoea triloba]